MIFTKHWEGKQIICVHMFGKYDEQFFVISYEYI